MINTLWKGTISPSGLRGGKDLALRAWMGSREERDLIQTELIFSPRAAY